MSGFRDFEQLLDVMSAGHSKHKIARALRYLFRHPTRRHRKIAAQLIRRQQTRDAARNDRRAHGILVLDRIRYCRPLHTGVATRRAFRRLRGD